MTIIKNSHPVTKTLSSSIFIKLFLTIIWIEPFLFKIICGLLFLIIPSTFFSIFIPYNFLQLLLQNLSTIKTTTINNSNGLNWSYLNRNLLEQQIFTTTGGLTENNTNILLISFYYTLTFVIQFTGMLLFLFGCIHYFILQNYLYSQQSQFLQQQLSTTNKTTTSTIITDRNVNLEEEEEGQQLINVIDSSNDNIFHSSPTTFMEKLLSIEKLNSFKWLILVLLVGDFIHLGVVMLYVSNWNNYWFIIIPISLSLSLALMRVCYLMFHYFGELLIHFVKSKNYMKKEKVHDFRVDELTAQ